MSKRDSIQNDAHIEWLNANKKGTVEIATGMGKTFIFLHALHSMPKNEKINIFLAETKERKKDLLEQIEKYDKIFDCDTINDYILQFECYQTVYKWENKHFGLVGADEIHDALTPVYSLFFENNTYDAIIGLSAKIDTETTYTIKRGNINIPIKKEYYLEKYCPIIYQYSLQEARTDDLNRDVKVHIIHNVLDSNTKNIVAGNKKVKFMQTEQEYYDYWNKKYMNACSERDYMRRDLFKKIAVVKRTQFLYNLPSKVDICRKLLKHIDRVIVFGNSIDGLLKVTPNVISSRNSDAQNDYYRRRFERNELQHIASFKKVKQGANIKRLNNVIMMSYFSTEKDLIQRFGRIRANPDEEGNVFIIVTRNTVEAGWYINMIQNVEKTYNIFNHTNVDECIKFLKYKQNEH